MRKIYTATLLCLLISSTKMHADYTPLRTFFLEEETPAPHLIEVNHFLQNNQDERPEWEGYEEYFIDEQEQSILSKIFTLFMRNYFKLLDHSPGAVASKSAAALEIFGIKQTLPEGSYGKILGEYAYEELMGRQVPIDSPLKKRHENLFQSADAGFAREANLLSLFIFFDLCMIGDLSPTEKQNQAFHYADIAKRGGFYAADSILSAYISLLNAKECTQPHEKEKRFKYYKNYLTKNHFAPSEEKREILETLHQEDPEEAITIALSVIERSMNIPEDKLNLANLYMLSKEWQKAVETYESLEGAIGVTLFDKIDWAFAYEKMENYKKAFELYEEIARMYLELKDYEAVTEFYAKAAPKDVKTLANIPLTYKRRILDLVKKSENLQQISIWLEAIALDSTEERSPEVRSKDNSNAAHGFLDVKNGTKFSYYLFK